MKQTITKSMFRDAFYNSSRKDSFSYEALGAMYDWLEELDEDFELDIIALDCEFMEDSIKNVLENYNLKSLEELQDYTIVVWDDGENVLYQVY